MIYVWSAILLYLGAASEVVLGTTGLPTPFAPLVAFYIFVIYGWRRTIAIALPAVLVADVYFARPGLPTVAMLPLIAYISWLWRTHGDSTHRLSLALPGMTIAVLGGIAPGLSAMALQAHPVGAIITSFAVILPACAVVGAVALPVGAWVFDFIADRAGLTRIADIKPPRKRPNARKSRRQYQG